MTTSREIIREQAHRYGWSHDRLTAQGSGGVMDRFIRSADQRWIEILYDSRGRVGSVRMGRATHGRSPVLAQNRKTVLAALKQKVSV